jgi:hypothetical protein
MNICDNNLPRIKAEECQPMSKPMHAHALAVFWALHGGDLLHQYKIKKLIDEGVMYTENWYNPKGEFMQGYMMRIFAMYFRACRPSVEILAMDLIDRFGGSPSMVCNIHHQLQALKQGIGTNTFFINAFPISESGKLCFFGGHEADTILEVKGFMMSFTIDVSLMAFSNLTKDCAELIQWAWADHAERYLSKPFDR